MKSMERDKNNKLYFDTSVILVLNTDIRRIISVKNMYLNVSITQQVYNLNDKLMRNINFDGQTSIYT